MIYARKINKSPEFYMIFAPKMLEFYVIIAQKIFFPNFGGHVPLDPPRLLRLCSLNTIHSWTQIKYQLYYILYVYIDIKIIF